MKYWVLLVFSGLVVAAIATAGPIYSSPPNPGPDPGNPFDSAAATLEDTSTFPVMIPPQTFAVALGDSACTSECGQTFPFPGEADLKLDGGCLPGVCDVPEPGTLWLCALVMMTLSISRIRKPRGR